MYFNKYFYPKNYIKNDNGDYINITVSNNNSTFPVNKHTIFNIEYDYPEFHLHMDCFLCSLDGVEPSLLEHMSAKWLKLSELSEVKWLEADLSIIEKLKNSL